MSRVGNFFPAFNLPNRPRAPSPQTLYPNLFNQQRPLNRMPGVGPFAAAMNNPQGAQPRVIQNSSNPWPGVQPGQGAQDLGPGPSQSMDQSPGQQQSGGFPMFGGGQQQSPWVLPWTYGQVANTAQNFGGMLQGAMGQIGNQLNLNANRIAANRPLQAAYDIDRRGQEYQHEAMMAQIANQGRLFDMMGQGFGAMGGGPAGSVNITGGPSMAAQGAGQEARSNIYGGLLGDLSGAAFSGGPPLAGFQSPGGEVSATVPTPPWAGGGAGGVQTGIDTTPGRVWNQELAGAAKGRLGAFAGRTLPFLNAAPSSGREGLAQNFQDLVGGLTGRSFNDISRAGTRAEGQHQLAAQTGASQAQQGLWKLMQQIYGSQLGGNMQNQMLNLRMLQALA